jgi:serine/threonine protein kinase
MYPSRSEIVTAMKNPQVSFRCDALFDGQLKQVNNRLVQYAGGFATVFPFTQVSGKKMALRCWIADIGEAKLRTRKISNYLKTLKSDYFVSSNYIDDALLVSGKLYPVALLDWVSGEDLKTYIGRNIDNPAVLVNLADKFKNMCQFMNENGVSHGDLQHLNILVRKNDENLVLIDYDSMYVPELDGYRDEIKGIPSYQHPKRQLLEQLSPKTDYFSQLVIYTGILAFAKHKDLWTECKNADYDLLFSTKDYETPNASSRFKQLCNSSDETVKKLSNRIIEELKKPSIEKLLPLSEYLIDKKKVALKNIFDKVDKHKPPVKKTRKPTTPEIDDIFNKF